MENLVTDVRYAFRTFVRNPAFTAVAVLSLALGIGVNVVIFSVVNTVLQKPIGGVTDAGRLVRVYRGSHSPLGYQDFRYFRDSVRSFAGLVAERLQAVAADRGGTVEPLQAAVVPGDYFEALGVRPARGRVFTATTSDPVAVLGHRYWERELGADPTIIGKTIRLNDTPYLVIGVATVACLIPGRRASAEDPAGALRAD